MDGDGNVEKREGNNINNGNDADKWMIIKALSGIQIPCALKIPCALSLASFVETQSDSCNCKLVFAQISTTNPGLCTQETLHDAMDEACHECCLPLP